MIKTGIAAAIFTLITLLGDMSQAAEYPTSLTQASSHLKNIATLRADFTQTKQLPALTRPFVVNGTLFYQRGEGIIWRIEKPYRYIYLLQAERITEIAPDGSHKIRDTRDFAALAQINQVFQAMMQADFDILKRHFTLETSGNDTNWQVRLQPKQGVVQQSLREVLANGSKHVDEILISGVNGDSTRIVFSASRENVAPGAEETRLLAGE